MSWLRGWAALALMSVVPAAAHAERLVDYTIDEATAAQYAAEQGVALAPLPARGALHIALRIDPAVDHQVLRVGVACSAWKVRNPLSAMIGKAMAAWDRGGTPASAFDQPADLKVSIVRAATLSRCVFIGEMKTTCITRVSIDGTAARAGEAAKAFHVEREEPAKGIGACAGLTRGIGLISRQAVSDLAMQLGAVPAKLQ